MPAALAPSGYSWAPARQTAPDGRPRAGAIPVNGHLAAGHTAPLWAGAARWPARPAPSHGAVRARLAAAAVAAIAAAGIALLCLARAGRWALDRRRLAGWEAAWAAVGPNGPNASDHGASMPGPLIAPRLLTATPMLTSAPGSPHAARNKHDHHLRPPGA